jgi:hypothetical protein
MFPLYIPRWRSRLLPMISPALARVNTTTDVHDFTAAGACEYHDSCP